MQAIKLFSFFLFSHLTFLLHTLTILVSGTFHLF